MSPPSGTDQEGVDRGCSSVVEGFLCDVEPVREGSQSEQRGREVSQLNLQYFGEELIVPSGALPLSFQAVRGGMML